jgi:hypothetical protein
MLPGEELSPNARVHWVSRYQSSKIYGQAVFYCCVNVCNRLERLPWRPGFPPFRRPRLDLTFVFSEYRERDEDNLRAQFKPGQDAIVRAGLIEGDSTEQIVLGKISIEVDKERAPLTIIELEEVEDGITPSATDSRGVEVTAGARVPAHNDRRQHPPAKARRGGH